MSYLFRKLFGTRDFSSIYQNAEKGANYFSGLNPIFNLSLRKNIIRKASSLILAFAILTISSIPILAEPPNVTSEITFNGQVSVNGQTAIFGSTLASGSRIITGANSTATVNLGENGRIEILGESSLNLKFTENSITGALSSGKIRIINSSGIVTSFTTSNSTVIAEISQANNFSIDVGCGNDSKCAETHVETASGQVTLRHGSIDKIVNAGMYARVGDSSKCSTCLRANAFALSFPVAGTPFATILGLIGAGGGTTALLITQNSSNDGDAPVNALAVSPMTP